MKRIKVKLLGLARNEHKVRLHSQLILSLHGMIGELAHGLKEKA